jgi:predicted Zn-dependent protease
MNRNRFELALLAIDAIDKHVDGDPYLDAIRATVYLQMNKHDVARKKADAAVAAVPDVVQVHAIAAAVSVQQHDFDGAVKVLDTMEEKFGKTLGPDPADDDAWKAFFGSDEYHAWDANKQ